MQTSMQLLGPSTFPFNRLVMIFRSIIGDQGTLSANLISQVSAVYLFCHGVKIADIII